MKYQFSAVEGEDRGISLAANVTHSIDAYVMRKTVAKCPFEVLVIHDEYKCHPNNVTELRTAYATTLAAVNQSNLLESILTQITGNPVKIKKSKANYVKDIKQAEYALN